MEDTFTLIGVVQNNKTVDELIRDFRKYDTQEDWTYGFQEADLKDVSEDALACSRAMTEQLTQYGFTIYDTSKDREQVLNRIVEEIKSESQKADVAAKIT